MYRICFFFSLLILGSCTRNEDCDPSCLPVDEQSIQIADPLLKRAISLALNKPTGNITSADALKLSDLRVQGELSTWVLSLEGLQYFKNLTSLDLSFNKIVDVRALSDLTKLNHLNLEGNEIADIQPLQTLTSLRTLNLKKNQIRELTALASLSKLQDLDLSLNRIKTIQPLASLANLQSVAIAENFIEDVAPLLASKNTLISLNVSNNYLSDIQHIAQLDKLQTLGIVYNPLQTISPLKTALPHLQRLDAESGLMIADNLTVSQVFQGFEVLEHKLDSIIASNVTPGQTDAQKLRAVHLALARAMRYDYNFKATSTNVLGVLNTAEGICYGFTGLSMMLHRRLGIKSIWVNGTAGIDKIGHAWNLVLLNKQWYALDLTWDIDASIAEDFKYFLISDATLKSHDPYRQWEQTDYPVATTDWK